MAPPAAAAYPPSCRETFPGVPGLQHFSVPANATSSNSIAVPVVGQIADIDVRIWASGVAAGDFSFGPDDDFVAHRVELDSMGGAVVDLAGATYDDEAAGARTGSSPFSGSYRPAGPLSALDGSQTKRSWKLEVANSSFTPFNVNAWSITITYAGCAPDRDSDGVSDAHDSCPGLLAHTASGCPVASRSLTAKYKRGKHEHGKFKGVLSSSAAGCRAARPVTIWKVRGGPTGGSAPRRHASTARTSSSE